MEWPKYHKSFAYVSLTGKVLKWHWCLTRNGILLNFVDFTAAFLELFASTCTAYCYCKFAWNQTTTIRGCCLIFHPSWNNELELLPAAARHLIKAVMPAAIANLEGFATLHADVWGFIPTIVDVGITASVNHVAIQLFVDGLKPAIQDEMRKDMPVLCGMLFNKLLPL
jgi:hypothetical protein